MVTADQIIDTIVQVCPDKKSYLSSPKVFDYPKELSLVWIVQNPTKEEPVAKVFSISVKEDKISLLTTFDNNPFMWSEEFVDDLSQIPDHPVFIEFVSKLDAVGDSGS